MPHIIGIMGNLGAGKTTVASMMAWRYKNAIESRGGSVKLFANYDLLGADRLAVAEDWFKVAAAHGSICVWDEAHRSFDSRKSQGFEQILATEILTFTRKMASIQIFATPSVSRLDTRIREMLEILLHVRPMGHKGIRIDYYDYQAENRGPLGQFLHSRFLPSFKVKQIHRLNLFDTNSFVSKLPLPKTERAANKFMSELERHHNEARRALDNDDSPAGENQERPADDTIPLSVDTPGTVHKIKPGVSSLEGRKHGGRSRKNAGNGIDSVELLTLGTQAEV